MTKELKQLRAENPDILSNSKVNEEQAIRHFMFSVVDDTDMISICVCGVFQGGHVKHKIHAVDCPDCLAALDFMAGVDTHDDALAYADSLLPRYITPDPDKMTEKHGTQFTRTAMKHIKARRILDSKFAESPQDLPKRMIGGTPRTFYKNMYEIGLIDKDGSPTGMSAQDLAEGKSPDQDDEITEG